MDSGSQNLLSSEVYSYDHAFEFNTTIDQMLPNTFKFLRLEGRAIVKTQ